MSFKRAILTLCLFLVITFTSNGQITLNNFLDDVENKSQPQEKVYLHLDKFSYTAGEKIWFKVYTTIGIKNLLSNWSKIAYVELISPDNKIIKTIKIPLVMGLGIGDFELSDEIIEGSYRIRAYTNWMRNDDPGYFFDRVLQVSNGRVDNVTTVSEVREDKGEFIYNIGIKGMHGEPLIDKVVNYSISDNGNIVGPKVKRTDNKGNIEISVDKKFSKEFFITLNIITDKDLEVTKIVKHKFVSNPYSVQLFPEGGNLLSGFVNTIGFKAVNDLGKGVSAKIKFVSDSDSSEEFSSNDLGMGSAALFITQDAKYKAIAIFEDGTSQEVPFPKVLNSGYTIVVDAQNENKLLAQLSMSDDKLDQTSLYFVVHHLGEILQAGELKSNSNEIIYNVNKTEFPNGVLTLTVLNAKFQPIVERVFFNFNKSNSLPIDVLTNKPIYNKREKVGVSLKVGGDSELKLASLSSTIIDLSKIEDKVSEEDNIISSLLISNDIKGYIEKSGHYFNEGLVKLKDIDYLMLTQGWRKFDWTLSPKSVEFPVEKSLKISGITKQFGENKIQPNVDLVLLSNRDPGFILQKKSDVKGYFEFDSLIFSDREQMIISGKNEKGKNRVDFEEDKSKEQIVNANKNSPDEINDVNRVFKQNIVNTRSLFAEFETLGTMNKIEEVLIEKKLSKVPSFSSNLNGAGRADQIITSDLLGTCNGGDLGACLSGRIMGVQFRTNDQGVSVPYNRGEQMLVTLDGMDVEPENFNLMINLVDIASIEVLRNSIYTTVYGGKASGGVLVLTSKTGLSGTSNRFLQRGLLPVTQKGYHVNRMFYKPDYNNVDQQKMINDQRVTIHWEPDISTNKNGEASFDFFTSDNKGRYLLIIEGVDVNGRLGRQTKEIVIQ